MWILRAEGTLATRVRALPSICFTRLGGTPRATSTWPPMRAATRVDSSGMGFQISVFTFGAPPQYVSLASSTSSSSLRQRTNLNGPEPTG